MTDSPRQLFHQAEAMPYGAGRVAAMETVVRHADADPADGLLPFEARLALIYSYIAAGERVKSFVPFAWCLREYDADPARYAEFTHSLMWAFKWQPDGLTRFPEVPLARTLEFLDDMESRYRIGGHSLFAVHQLRLLVTRHIGDVDAAAEHYRHWEASRPDDLADCRGCWPTAKVEYLVEQGRHTDALRIAEPVLRGSLTCNEQPQHILTALLPAYVATGRLEEAVDAHRKAYRVHRTRRSSLENIAGHIELLARTGNEVHALDLVEEHVGWLSSPDSPWAALRFSASAAHALAQLDPALVVRRAGENLSAGELAAELATQARALGLRFDERNGTDRISRLVEEKLTGEPWLDELPLNAAARKAQAVRRRVEARTVAPPVSEGPLLEGLDANGLLDEFERRWWADELDGVEEVIEQFEATVPVESRTVVQRGRLLEARGLIAALTDLERALTLWRTALPLLDESGESARVQRTRLRIGRTLCELGEVEEGLATGESAARWLVEHDLDHLRSGWALSLAGMLLSVRPEDAHGLLAGLDHESTSQAVRAALVDADALLRLERMDEAAGALGTAVSLSAGGDPRLELTARSRRGWIRLKTGDPGGAVEDLAEANALMTALGGQSPYLLSDLASAQLGVGDGEAAVDAAEQALNLLERMGDTEHLLFPRRILVDAYLALGSLDLALRNLRALLTLEPSDQLPWVHEQEGVVLGRMDQDAEALAAFRRSADGFREAGLATDEVRALRRAAEAAGWVDDAPQAAELRARATAALDRLPDEDATFHRAGLAQEQATVHADAGETETAARLLEEAEELYHRIGAGHLADDCVLRRAEIGIDPGPGVLAEIHERAEEGGQRWYRSGYQLLDSLVDAGRTAEADRLREQLESA